MKFVPNAVSRKVARQVLLTQKHSPTILFVGGVIGVVGTVVLACKATLDLDETLEATKKRLHEAHEMKDHGSPIYVEQDYNKDLAYIYLHAAMDMAKLYGPAIVVGAASIGALTGSHRTLSKRNAGMVAAYAVLEKSFDEYRQRVIGEIGEEKERKLAYDYTACEVADEKGKAKTKQIRVGGYSPYARLFDETCKSWSKTPDYNVVFLRCQQNYANDMLKSRGHVFLNEVYDALGMERTKEGAVVGWVWQGDGDNYVDFGVFDGRVTDRFYDFITGHEDAIWLDFNVDGVIYDKI